MSAQICFKRLGVDDVDRTTHLEVLVSDGYSTFRNLVLIQNDALSRIDWQFRALCDDFHSGIYDLNIGVFGKGYAYGAFCAHFRFYEPGKLCISTFQETDFFEFAGKSEANQAKLHLRSEPALLQNFSVELTQLVRGSLEEAKLICL